MSAGGPGRGPNSWLVAAAVALPAFMEVIDTSIANVALRYIAGGLSAASGDAEWVITSYLASNAVVKRCVGDPPRQTEDPQSPPCVAYWTGDNGGATWKGVTHTTVTVVTPVARTCDTDRATSVPSPG